MKERERFEPDIDGLLKQTLRDDLPAEIGAKMKRRLDEFRRQTEESAGGEIRPALTRRRPWILLTRSSLTAAAVLFIVLGFSLTGRGRRSILSDSIAAFQKVAVISGKISDARSMECVVRLSQGAELRQEFRIQWLLSGQAVVRIMGPEGELTRAVRLPPSRRSVLEHLAQAETAAGEKGPELDAELLPVEGLLSPSRLVGLLQGTWEPEGNERRGDCDLDSFFIFGSRLEPRSKVTVDGCTGLPTRLVRETGPGETVEAVFRWSGVEPGPVKLTLKTGAAGKTRAFNS